MAISKLLKQYLGDSVRFAGGNKNLCNEIECAVSKQDNPVVVYVDVSPDNPEVVDKYIELQVMQCVQNVNVENGCSVKGKFYMGDCNCDERYTKNCKKKCTVWSKYCMLVKALGVLPYEMYSSLYGDAIQSNRVKCGEEIRSVHVLYERLYDLVGYKRFLRFTW